MKSNVADAPDTSSLDPRTSMAMEIIAMNQRMKASAADFRNRWEDSAKYIQPRKGNIVTKNSPGQPQTQNIYDTTAEEALLIFAAGLISNLTPIGQRWCVYQPRNRDAPEQIKEWFEDASNTILEMIGRSNFYLGLHESFLDDGCFATSVLQIDETDGQDDDDTPFTTNNVSVGTFVYAESNKGMVDTVLKEWKWTARQAAQEFEGRGTLGPHLRKALDSANAADREREFTFILRVRPRRLGEFDQGPAVASRRKWAQEYVCVEDQNVIMEEGTYEMPLMACRLLSSNAEIYGRGPGIQAMPTIKMVNRMQRDLLVTRDKMADPGWIMGDDQSMRPDNRPGGVTYYDSTRPNSKPEQLKMTNQVDSAEQETERMRNSIRKAFYNDMFQMLSSLQEQKREKTAYEVSQMVAEQLVLFSPIFAKIVKEKLNPALHRIFGIALRKGMLKPFPVGFEMAGGYEVEYTSKIALAIKAIQNQSLAAAVQIIQSLAPLDPSVALLLKARDAGRQVLRNVGVQPSWLRADDEIDEILKVQQEKQSQLEAAQSALAASQAAKNLGPGAQQAATAAIQTAA